MYPLIHVQATGISQNTPEMEYFTPPKTFTLTLLIASWTKNGPGHAVKHAFGFFTVGNT